MTDTWIGTFGSSHRLLPEEAGGWAAVEGAPPPEGIPLFRRFVRIKGTYAHARAEMIRVFGLRWCDLYPSEESAGIQAYSLSELVITSASSAPETPEDVSAVRGEEILDLPLVYPFSGGKTVRWYLGQMLLAAWKGKFSPKYGMTGESDWEYDLLYALIAGGFIAGVSIEDGVIPDNQQEEWRLATPGARSMIADAIRAFIRQAGREQ
jgi:hypothetical protein